MRYHLGGVRDLIKGHSVQRQATRRVQLSLIVLRWAEHRLKPEDKKEEKKVDFEQIPSEYPWRRTLYSGDDLALVTNVNGMSMLKLALSIGEIFNIHRPQK